MQARADKGQLFFSSFVSHSDRLIIESNIKGADI